MLARFLFIFALLAASPCLANIAAIRVPGHTAAGPVVAEPTPLTVEREELRITCDDAGEPRCGFEARYHVVNPTAGPESVVAAFYGLATTAVSIDVDGAPAQTQLGQDEARALDQALAAVQATAGSHPAQRELPGAPDRVGLTLEVPAGGRRTITVQGGFALQPMSGGSYVIPAIELRHMVLAQGDGERAYELSWLVSPIRTWGGAGPVELEVTAPADWRVFVGDGERPLVLASDAMERREQTVRRATLDPAEIASLHILVKTPRRDVRIGGPLIGVGTDFEDGRLLLRAGFELALQSWLLAGVAVETDASERILVAPLVEATTPWLLIIPAASMGLGVPVLVGPDGTDVGIRMEPAISFPFVSVHFPLDIYPGKSTTHPDFFQASWVIQLSL